METAGSGSLCGLPLRYAVIFILSLAVSLVTVYCLVNGIQTVFPHLYYVPIILAAYWFRRDGVLYAAGMGLLYLSLVVVITGYNPNNVIAAAGRFIVFVIIAAVVAVLSMRLSTQQEEVVRSEEKFRTIWENIPAGVMVVDAGTHEIAAVNPEFEQMTGYTEKEMIGRSCHQLVCPAEKGSCPISDKGLTIDHSERVVLARNGKSFPVIKTVRPVTIGGRALLVEIMCSHEAKEST